MSLLPSDDPKDNLNYTIVKDIKMSDHVYIHKEVCMNLVDKPYIIGDKDVKTGLI